MCEAGTGMKPWPTEVVEPTPLIPYAREVSAWGAGAPAEDRWRRSGERIVKFLLMTLIALFTAVTTLSLPDPVRAFEDYSTRSTTCPVGGSN